MEILAQTVNESYFVKQRCSSLEQNNVCYNEPLAKSFLPTLTPTKH